MNKLLGRYNNGNYTIKIFSNGTKIRETDEDVFISSFPECIDLKITNYCDLGCKYCHEDSNINGKHGDILNAEFINTIKPYTEIACINGDSVVYGEKGAIEVKDLKIDDYIFDSEHKLRKIININKTNKKIPIKLYGNKGFNIICSTDHPFIIKGDKIIAENLFNKSIDLLNNIKEEFNENKDYIINMSKYIKPPSDLISSRGGKEIDENLIRLRNCTNPIPKYIKIDNDLMWLYGLFVAEGSNKGLTLNIEEKEYADKVRKIWKGKTGNNVSCYTNEDKNSIDIELQSATLIEDLFINEFNVGKGARNKSINYLFSINNKELIKNALIGLFDGDGAYRSREMRGTKQNCASLKTTSKKLAYEVLYLLKKWFDISASIYYGISKCRKIEDRILDESDYYMVEIYNKEDLLKIFEDRFIFNDRIIKKSKESKLIINKIEKLHKYETLYDITLDKGTHIFPINGYILTHNCGGGNALSHPDLIPFLIKLKDKNIIANITVNQKHFISQQEIIKYLIENDLIKGLGVSLNSPSDEFIELIKQYSNAVIHVINGIVTLEELQKLYSNDLKLLILGYKEFRRGKQFYSSDIEDNKKIIYDNITNIIKGFKVVSFDNLAINQLKLRRIFSNKDWNEFYMGDDGQFTMYIDLVEEKYALSSTSIERYKIMNDIVDMFNVVKSL